MRIMRNGMQFTLSGDELRNAYYEQQHLFDIEDVKAQIDEALSDDETDEKLKSALKYIETDEKLDEIAYEKRRNEDKYDMNWLDAALEAINEKLRIEGYSVHI